MQLAVTVKDANGNVITGLPVTWSVSNGALASVSATGLVKGLLLGDVVVTATVGGVQGQVALHIGL